LCLIYIYTCSSAVEHTPRPIFVCMREEEEEETKKNVAQIYIEYLSTRK